MSIENRPLFYNLALHLYSFALKLQLTQYKFALIWLLSSNFFQKTPISYNKSKILYGHCLQIAPFRIEMKKIFVFGAMKAKFPIFTAPGTGAPAAGSFKVLSRQLKKRNQLSYSADSALLFFLVCCIRQQCNDSCSLDRSCYFSLVYCASSGDSLRKNLTSFRYIFFQFFNVFVIYGFCLVRTELAYFFSSHAAASSIHDIISFLLEWDVLILDGLESLWNPHVILLRR